MGVSSATPRTDRTGLPAQLAPNRRRVITERIVHGLLFAAAAISVLTTAGISFTLLGETVQFFRDVSVFEFITGTRWTPLFASKDFGVLPLVNGTLAVALVAMVVAIPVGLLTAVFLSEYAPPRLRSILKPCSESVLSSHVSSAWGLPATVETDRFSGMSKGVTVRARVYLPVSL